MNEAISRIHLEAEHIFKTNDDGWTAEVVQKGLLELQRLCDGVELVRLTGKLPLWVTCAVAAAIEPSVLWMEETDQLGTHQLVCTPFPIDAGGSDSGVRVEVHELMPMSLVTVACDPSQFNFLLFDHIVVPPVMPGLRLKICTPVPTSIAVSMMLSYASQAESIWMPEGDEEEREVCVVSHTADCRVGERITHKIEKEKVGSHG